MDRGGLFIVVWGFVRARQEFTHSGVRLCIEYRDRCSVYTVSGHWDLANTGTTRDYDTLVWSLGWQCECMAHTLPGAGWQCECMAHTIVEWEQCGQILQPSLVHQNVTFSPVGHARLPIWLRPLTAKRANNQGKRVNISNSTTLIGLTLVSGDSWRIALTLWG